MKIKVKDQNPWMFGNMSNLLNSEIRYGSSAAYLLLEIQEIVEKDLSRLKIKPIYFGQLFCENQKQWILLLRLTNEDYSLVNLLLKDINNYKRYGLKIEK